MNILLLFMLSSVATLISVAQGTVTYGSLYNPYGGVNQVKPHYPEALVTYGPPQRRNNQPAVQRGQFYSPRPQKPYYPAQTRTYTPVQPRRYAPVRHRMYSQAQTRAYTYGQPRLVYRPAQPRSNPPAQSQPYVLTHPQVYAQNHPQPVNALGQIRSYTRPAAAQRYFMPTSQAAVRPVVRQPMNSAVRQQIQPIRPMSASLIGQPIKPLVTQPLIRQPIGIPQTPLTRTMALKQPILYRPSINSRFPQRLSAQPIAPGTYSRNHIPKNPAIFPRKPIPPGKPTSRYPSNRRNNIAFNKQLQTTERTLAARNYIDGVDIPQAVAGKVSKWPMKPQMNTNPVRSPIQPIKPQMNLKAGSQFQGQPIRAQVGPNSPTGQKLSTFLKKVNKLQDTLKGNTMKQGLIYYDDDVSNKSQHRPTNFAPPTRKLGSMGSPGGSRVTFNEEPTVHPAIIPETKAVNRPGSERVTITQAEKTVAKNKESDKNTQSESTTDIEQPLTKKSEVAEKPLSESSTEATGPRTENNTGQKQPMSPEFPGKTANFAAAQVDLGLLKQKVLHSNNSQFLKRVLHVLRKYTKLMKTSIAGKNDTRNVLNFSIAHNNKGEMPNEEQTGKNKDISKINNTISESVAGTDLSNALNSTKTAVKMFDLLNSASKPNLKSSLVSEINQEAVSHGHSSVPMKDSSKKPAEGEDKASDLMNLTLKSKAEKIVKDENASKKEKIETERNVGKPLFNVEKLKYGLQRGNTID
ncbi:uncharacterized protein LOC114518488 [Dendronephthya gigantea]|uniref:uncharacterized protein LOC114518488 n=1 Tax=Dendronephthya gigantea TaxID=151771 RepID=UPI00106CC791|nr:uncharacterized protein LOC114518488 [Dendronephthya gigantea]